MKEIYFFRSHYAGYREILSSDRFLSREISPGWPGNLPIPGASLRGALMCLCGLIPSNFMGCPALDKIYEGQYI